MDDAKLARDRAEAALRRIIAYPEGRSFGIVTPDSIPIVDASPDVAEQQALKNSSTMQQNELDNVQSKRAISYSKANNRFNATVGASVGFNQTAPQFGQAYQSPLGKQTLTVDVNLPMLQGTARPKWKRPSANDMSRRWRTTRAAAINWRRTRASPALGLQQAQRNVLISAKADTVASKQFEVARNRYIIGKITNDALYLAQGEKDAAVLAYVQALRNYWTAYFHLRRVTLYDFVTKQEMQADVPRSGGGSRAGALVWRHAHPVLPKTDRQLRASITRGLREASYEVDAVQTGTQAYALATSNEYDIVLLDLLLPGRGGLDVCQDIRARGSRVPILMLTALDAVEQRIAGLDAGADDYLTKPFDFGELLARMRALTRRVADAPSAQVVVGDLVVDRLRRSARRGNREINLTAREFEFLSYLCSNAGRVVSRAELMEHVWHETRTSYSNIIDVYASRLRRKLDEGENVSLFTTMRGSGFLLDAPAYAAGKGQPARRNA